MKMVVFRKNCILSSNERRLTVRHVACSAGGVDIEEVARLSPDKIARVIIDPWHGLRDYQARSLRLQLICRLINGVHLALLPGFWQIFTNFDANLAEINPLVMTTSDTFTLWI